VSDAAFVDTAYFVALLDPRDALNGKALEVAETLASRDRTLVTSDAVLLELANYFSRSPLRATAIDCIDAVRSGSGWEVVPINRPVLARAEARYRAHTDKTWSLTDCLSMEMMNARGIRDVVTTDAGFAQAGFRPLMRR
jgi:predicted nucleic acid-binding protein